MLEKIQDISRSKDYKPGSSFGHGKRFSDASSHNQQSFNDKLTLSPAIKHLLSLGWKLQSISSSSDKLYVSVGIENFNFSFFLTEENLDANGRFLFNMQRTGSYSDHTNPVLHFSSILTRTQDSSDNSTQSVNAIISFYEITVEDFQKSDESMTESSDLIELPQKMLPTYEAEIEFVIKNLIKFASAYINSYEEIPAVPLFKCETEITGIGR